MILSVMRTRVRERARTSSDFVADSLVTARINEAITQFSKDMNGLAKEVYLALTPKFDLYTHQAFSITIVGGTNALVATDIPVTDTSVNDQTGAETATELQERIRAAGPTTLTVTWDSATFLFTISNIDGTSITIASPSGANYSDITDLLFAKLGTQTGYTWVSNIPQDCMLAVDLPGDFLRIKSVEWDRNPLCPAPFDLFVSPQAHGTPSYYQILNKTMRLNAVPTSQKLLHIFYDYLPTALVDSTDDAVEVDIPNEIEDAIIFYAAALLYEDAGDLSKANYFRARYVVAKNEYKQQISNQNPKFRRYVKDTIRKFYRVVT